MFDSVTVHPLVLGLALLSQANTVVDLVVDLGIVSLAVFFDPCFVLRRAVETEVEF